MEKWSCATRVNLVPLWVWRERPESASTKGWFPTWRHETPRTHSSGAGGWTICQAVKPQLTCRSAWVQPFRSVITGDEPAIIWHLLRVFFIVGISVGPCGLIQTHTENEGVINVGQSGVLYCTVILRLTWRKNTLAYNSILYNVLCKILDCVEAFFHPQRRSQKLVLYRTIKLYRFFHCESPLKSCISSLCFSKDEASVKVAAGVWGIRAKEQLEVNDW